jgi:Zn-dependent protease
MRDRIPKKGYLGPFYVQRVPVLIHWTFPVGGIAVAYFLGDVTRRTAIPLIFAYTTLILIHEFGHAIAALSSGSKVHAVLVTGAGGWCFVDEPQSYASRFAFYAGGIIAQLLVLVITAVSVTLFENTNSIVLNLYILVFTVVNIVLIFINIVPSEGTDGKALWLLAKEYFNAD